MKRYEIGNNIVNLIYFPFDSEYVNGSKGYVLEYECYDVVDDFQHLRIRCDKEDL
jgi:hypothetical protein